MPLDEAIEKLMSDELAQAQEFSPKGKYNSVTLAIRRDDSTLPYIVGFRMNADDAYKYMMKHVNDMNICNMSHPAVAHNALIVSSMLTDDSVNQIASLSSSTDLEYLFRILPHVMSVHQVKKLLSRGAKMYVNERDDNVLPAGKHDGPQVVAALADTPIMKQITAQRQLASALSMVGEVLFTIEDKHEVPYNMVTYAYTLRGRDILKIVLGDMLSDEEWSVIDSVCDVWWQKAANALQSLYWDWNADVSQADDSPIIATATRLSSISKLAQTQRRDWQDVGRGVMHLSERSLADVADGVLPGLREKDVELMVGRLYDKGLAQQYVALVSGVPVEDVLA